MIKKEETSMLSSTVIKRECIDETEDNEDDINLQMR